MRADPDDGRLWTARINADDDVELSSPALTIGTQWTDLNGDQPDHAYDLILPSIDTRAPVINYHLDHDALAPGGSVHFAIQFDELPVDFTAEDLTLSSGLQLDSFEAQGSDLTRWHGTLSAQPGVQFSSSLITVGTSWSDIAGNSPAVSRSFEGPTIDTLGPSLTGLVRSSSTPFTVYQDEILGVTAFFDEPIIDTGMNMQLTLSNGKVLDLVGWSEDRQSAELSAVVDGSWSTESILSIQSIQGVDALFDNVGNALVSPNPDILSGPLRVNSQQQRPEFSLDIDLDGIVDPRRDGLLVLRFLLGRRGSDLISRAYNPLGERTDPNEITEWISSGVSGGHLNFDRDPNSAVEAHKDGLLLIRHLLDRESLGSSRYGGGSLVMRALASNSPLADSALYTMAEAADEVRASIEALV